jgi:hypothetical protein
MSDLAPASTRSVKIVPQGSIEIEEPIDVAPEVIRVDGVLQTQDPHTASANDSRFANWVTNVRRGCFDVEGFADRFWVKVRAVDPPTRRRYERKGHTRRHTPANAQDNPVTPKTRTPVRLGTLSFVSSFRCPSHLRLSDSVGEPTA